MNRPPQPAPSYNPQEEPKYDSNTTNESNQQPYTQQDPEKGGNGYYQDDTYKPQPSDSFEESFKIEKPRFNDVPFTLLFLATCAGFITVAVITIKSYSASHSFQGGSIYGGYNDFSLNTNTIILFAFVIVVAMVLSFFCVLWARLSPRTFIIFSLIANVVMGIGTAIAYLVMRYWSAGIVFLVFALINAWCYWSMRWRIPFSSTVLTIVIDVMKTHPSVLMTSLFGTIFAGAFSAFFSVTVVSTYIKYTPNADNTSCELQTCSNSKVIGILVFVFFAGYYITEVIRNIIHVTISGVYGTWYYLSKSDQGEPKHPLLGAFKRAMTYSFGSICFGSLIVSLIQLLKQLIVIFRQNSMNNGELCESIVGIFLECLISIIDWAVRYFNFYAYSYIALYGKSYVKSAKDTWQMLRYKGMDALVNDCLIGTLLSMSALFVAYTASLLLYLYLKLTNPAYNADGGFYAPVVAFTFVMSLQICNIVTNVIRSGVATFFIALAKDPEVFQMSYPEQFNEVLRNYPEVRTKITADA